MVIIAVVVSFAILSIIFYVRYLDYEELKLQYRLAALKEAKELEESRLFWAAKKN